MPHEPATKPWSAPASLAAVEWGLAAGALPAIAIGTGSPIGLAHWVLMAHYLAIAYGYHLLRVLQLFPDNRLRRRNGFLLLVIGSLACAAAPDAYTLVAARLPQAFGLACLLATQPRDATTNRLPVAALVIGLLAGSLVGHLVGWRVVFLTAAMLGLAVALRDWQREKNSDASPEALPPQAQPPQRHPMLLAAGLACIIVPVNSYCDFRVFGVAEGILLLVGIALCAVYARETVRNLVANRSPLLTHWIGAVVAGLCLLPALFHVQQAPAPAPALAVATCGMVLFFVRRAPPRVSRFAPVAGFLLLAGVLFAACFEAATESLLVLMAMAAAVGVGIGFTWTGNALRPVPLFSGLAAGVYVASYFLEFVPASFGSESSAAREFLRQETNVLLTAVFVSCAGAGWGVVCACRKTTA